MAMAAHRSVFVPLDHRGVRIHVSVSGSPGPPLSRASPAPADAAPEAEAGAGAGTGTAALTFVFLHYWGGSTSTWSSVAAGLAGQYQTLSMDFRGWGQSTGPDDAAGYSIRALAGDVEEVLVQLRSTGVLPVANRVVLVGLSMGAKVAQVVAARCIYARGGGGGGGGKGTADDSGTSDSPGLPIVAGVVLASPAPATSMQLPPDMQEQQLHAYDNADTASFVARAVLTESFRGDGGDGGPSPSPSPALPSFLVDDMLRGNRWAKAAWPAYAMAEDVTACSLTETVPEPLSASAHGPDGPDSGATRHAACVPPVLVLAAEKDVVEPLEGVRSRVLARIPGAQLTVIPQSGHLSPVDAPSAVVEALVRFAETVVNKGGR